MSAKQIITLPIDQLESDPCQVRKTISEESIVGLAATIARGGQVEPIVGYPHDEKVRIWRGHRRWLALKRAGKTTAEVLLVDKPIDDAQRIEQQLIENLQREDLPPLEAAAGMRTLMELRHWSAAELSRCLGKSEGQISKQFLLLDAPEEIRQAVASGNLAPSAAYELARVKDADQRSALASEASNGRLTREALCRKLKRIRRNDGGKRSTAHGFKATLGEGRSVMVKGRGLSLETLVEWLESLLVKAKAAKGQGISLEAFAATVGHKRK